MRPLKASVDPTAPKEHFALSGPELNSISSIEGAGKGWASGMSCIHRLGAELLKIRRMESLWFYLWAVSWTPEPQTVRHVALRSATVDVQPWQWSQHSNVCGWPCRQVPAGLLLCPIRAKRNPQDTCHPPSMFSTKKHKKTPATFFCLFF